MAEWGAAERVGMTPENYRKMMEVMPEGSIMASPSRSLLGSNNLKEQLKDLYIWGTQQDKAKLQKMTIPQMFDARHKALAEAVAKHNKMQQGEIVADAGDNWTWRKLGPEQVVYESDKMHHSVRGYANDDARYSGFDKPATALRNGDAMIFSLRNEKNEPAITIEVKKTTESDTVFKVTQIKGDFNDPEKAAPYAQQVKTFLDAKGWDYKDSGDWGAIENAVYEQKALPPEAEGLFDRIIGQVPGFEENVDPLAAQYNYATEMLAAAVDAGELDARLEGRFRQMLREHFGQDWQPE
jgi:hypothetical protein